MDNANAKPAAPVPQPADSLRETPAAPEPQPDALKPEFTARLTELFQRAKERALAAKPSPR